MAAAWFSIPRAAPPAPKWRLWWCDSVLRSWSNSIQEKPLQSNGKGNSKSGGWNKMFHAAAFLHIVSYKTQSAKLFDRPCLLRGISFIQCFDLFANLNIGFTFLRCFAGKEIQNINTVMMRLLATTSKDWGLSDVVPYIEWQSPPDSRICNMGLVWTEQGACKSDRRWMQ